MASAERPRDLAGASPEAARWDCASRREGLDPWSQAVKEGGWLGLPNGMCLVWGTRTG